MPWAGTMAARGLRSRVRRVRIKSIAGAEGVSAAEWAAALEAFEPAQGRVIKVDGDGDSGVFAARLASREVVVKVRAMSSAWDRLRHATEISQAARQWRGTAALTQAGVAAARCLVLARGEAASGSVELLVMERLSGEHVLQHLADGDLTLAQERAVSAAIGRGIAAMQSAGLFNGDHKPSNLIVMETGTGAGLLEGDDKAAQVVIVDTVAIRRVGIAGRGKALTRMLAASVIEPLGCGVHVRRTLWRRGLRGVLRASWDAQGGGPEDEAEFDAWERGSAKAIWRAVAQIVSRHPIGPPKVDPLRARR